MIETTNIIAAGGRSMPVRAILIGGLTAGAMDLSFAFSFWALKGVAPVAVLRGIATGWLGPAAGTGTAPVFLGLLSHFLLSLLFAAVFVLIASRVAALGRQSPWLAGPLYGVAVYFLMNRVVLPLSNFAVPADGTRLSFADLAAHMFLFGLPIALATQRWVRGIS
ncbi:MAG: hypothetical protein JHD35_05110 [Sphingopyxis sp.]|nr:hypothetical protein [Sphingopyxis sp.]